MFEKQAARLKESAERSPVKTATVLATIMGSVVAILATLLGGIFFMEDRYAHAEDLDAYKVEVTAGMQDVQKQTQQIQNMMILQMQTRKTILEMKEAQGNITPEEQVELQNLKTFLQQNGITG